MEQLGTEIFPQMCPGDDFHPEVGWEDEQRKVSLWWCTTGGVGSHPWEEGGEWCYWPASTE